MKTTLALLLTLAAFAEIQAYKPLTNAEQFRRGLPPLKVPSRILHRDAASRSDSALAKRQSPAPGDAGSNSGTGTGSGPVLITFDDITLDSTGFGPIPAAYKGFDWGIRGYAISSSSSLGSGYTDIMQSDPQCLYYDQPQGLTPAIRATSGRLFQIQSLYCGNLLGDAQTTTLVGKVEGAVVFEQALTCGEESTLNTLDLPQADSVTLMTAAIDTADDMSNAGCIDDMMIV